MPAADQDALGAEAATVIRDIVAPAYTRLLTMIREESLVKARTTLAAKAMPFGQCPMRWRRSTPADAAASRRA